MATTVKIYIRGLAFFYYKEATKEWKVIFLCEKTDTEHRLLFSFTGKPDPEPLYQKKKIEFIVSNEDPHGSHMGIRFRDIFNYVKDAHVDNGVVWKGTPTEALNVIEMTIPAAQVYLEKETDKEYAVVKIKNNLPGKPKKLRKVADIVGAIIKLKDNGSLSLKIDGNEVPLGFDYSKPGATYELWFDNNCDRINPDCGSALDSFLYYQLIEDAKEKDLYYIATRSTRAKKSGAVILSIDGNCDPVVSDPPPGDPPS